MAKLLVAPTKNGIQKTLAAQLLSTASTGDPITFDDVDGIPNLPGVLVINRVNTSNESTPSAREYIEYSGTSGTTVLITTRNVDSSNSALTHAVGSIVEFIPDVTWADRIYDALSNVVNVDTLAVDTSKVATPATVASSSIVLSGSNYFSASGATISTIKDDDTFATASDTSLATSESIKAYVDSGTITMTNKTLTSPVLQGDVSGWTASTDTWVYASASTFTIAGVDRTAVYTAGTRLKFTQTSAKYAVVVSSAFSTNTTVTIAVNTDYTIANAAISANYYSYQASPQGYPVFFNWTPTFSASGSMTTASPSITNAMFSITGGLLTGILKFQITTGGTASSYVYFTYPVIPSTTIGDFSTVGNANTDTNAGTMGAIGYSRTDTKMYIRRYDSGNFALTASHYSTGVFYYHL